jgi:MFS family permease
VSGTPPEYRDHPTATGARVSLALLLSINLFNYIDRYILSVNEPLIAKEFFGEGDSNTDFYMGLLATAFMVSYMVTAPVFGWLADRTRRWAIIGIGVSLWSLASGASGLAQAFGIMLATRVFVGIGEAAYGPTAPTVISDLFPVSRRGAVMAWFYLAIPVGSALGYGFGGVMAKHFGWRAPFYAVVIPGLLLGLLSFQRPEPERGRVDLASQRPRRKMRLSDCKVLLKTPSYLLATAGYTASTFAIGGISFWMPRYVATYRLHADLSTVAGKSTLSSVGLIFGAITAVGGLAATLCGGYLADRLRKRYSGAYFLVSGTGALIGFPLFLAALFVPFPYAWGLVLAAIFFLFLHIGPVNTIPANVTHPAIRASAYAILILIIHLFGDAFSPPVIGKINGAAGGNMNAGFLVVSVMILLAAALWLWGARYLEGDTARAPTSLDAPV